MVWAYYAEKATTSSARCVLQHLQEDADMETLRRSTDAVRRRQV